jgi:hypothetical protein
LTFDCSDRADGAEIQCDAPYMGLRGYPVMDLITSFMKAGFSAS